MAAVKRDENGDFVISSKALAVIGTIITILGFVLGLVYNAIALNERIVTVENKNSVCCQENVVVHPQVSQNTRDIAVLQTQVGAMNTKLDRIDNKLDKLIENQGGRP